ncbi:MAG: DbpA RNA binding domain-containing protein [Gemmatimonadota bacterium]|nr:MAG: DbpA RNA binding domain-containing protein [Gemmatimonadota bacterium]
MSTFADLKLGRDLLEYLDQAGFRGPTALQIEAVPVIARGTTAVGIASAGSGRTLAYGLGLASRLDPAAQGLQALVIRPTDDAAAATADALYPMLSIRGLTVSVVGPRSAVAAQVGVTSPGAALSALGSSAVKLEGVVVLIVDGASTIFDLDAGDALETLTAQIPRQAQRILLTAQTTKQVEGWIDRHARRARQLTYIPAEVEPLSDAAAQYYVGPRSSWLPHLAEALAGARGQTDWRVFCRKAEEACELSGQLAVRGIADARSKVGVDDDIAPDRPPAGLVVSWGTPFDLENLRRRLPKAGRALIFLEGRELAHLQLLANKLAVRLTALKSTAPAEALRSAQLTRERLREAALEADLEPYMLLLEPLLEEFTPTQLAAAATSLFREREPPTAAEPLPAWTRLYFGVGRRDGIRPADLVGAITGESSVGGDRIGRIDIRDTHCAVEVAASVADQVIKALASATIRGRPANVRLFRE